MRLYLIRHADPDYPNNTITPAGHLEAEALARRLTHEGLTRIYCSPLGRAVHTMQYTAQATGLTPQIEPWMAELDEFRIPLPPPWPALMAWDIPGQITRQEATPATIDTMKASMAPARKIIPSTFSVEAATTEVPGQNPPRMKPTPITSPPTIPGHR